MILFINAYITNKRFKPIKNLEGDRKHSRIDVFKYTLASYAVIPWTHVYINFELDEEFSE